MARPRKRRRRYQTPGPGGYRPPYSSPAIRFGATPGVGGYIPPNPPPAPPFTGGGFGGIGDFLSSAAQAAARARAAGQGGGAGPPYPGFMGPGAVNAEAARLAGLGINPQIAYYRRLIEERNKQGQNRAAFIAQLFGKLAEFQKGIGPQVAGIYQQAGKDQSAFAQGFSDGLRQTAQSDAGKVNAELARIGAPQGQMLPGDQGAGNVLYALGGRIPANTFSEQGAAFGSAASFLPGATYGRGTLEAQEALNAAQKEIRELQGEQAQIEAQRPGLIEQYRSQLTGRQDTLRQEAYQHHRDAVADAKYEQQRADDLAAEARTRGEKAAAARAQAKADAAVARENHLRWVYAVAEDRRRYKDMLKAKGLEASAEDAEINVQESKLRGYLVRNDGTTPVGVDGQPIPVYQKPKAPGKKSAIKIDKEASRALGVLAGIDPETGAIVAIPNARGNTVPYRPNTGTPAGKSMKTLIREREQAFAQANRQIMNDAVSYAGKGWNRTQAWNALYNEYKDLLRYSSRSGRASLDRRIRQLINQALKSAGYDWRKGGQSSHASKPKGEAGREDDDAWNTTPVG